MNATEFFQKLRKQTAPIHQEMLNLRFIRDAYEGRLPRSVLKGYSLERYLLITSPQIARVRSTIVSSKDVKTNQSESHIPTRGQLFGKFAEWAGNTANELDSSRPIFPTYIYSSFFTSLLDHGKAEELAGAYYFADEFIVQKFKRLIYGFEKHYGAPEDVLQFFRLHIAENVAHAKDLSSDVMEKNWGTQEAQERAEYTGMMNLRCYRFFLDSVYDHYAGLDKWPSSKSQTTGAD